MTPVLPLSFCTCGHTGDGPNGEHAPVVVVIKGVPVEAAPGHGGCTHPGCGCSKFTWSRFTDYGEYHADQFRRLMGVK